MKNPYKITLLSVLLVMPIALMAQKVEGRIFEIDHEKKVPLTGANVYWEGTTSGTITDKKGRFEIECDEKANQLIASFIGYNSDTLLVEKETCNHEEGQEHEHHHQETIMVEFILHKGHHLDEVTVAGRGMGAHVSRIDPIHTHNITGDELHKAACCNLSESFETEASVDVKFSDAITGAKQIRLLGLNSRYVQLMTENTPNLNGLANPFGMDYIPGTWMESIQISKGAASVLNGYESITGQINVEYKKPHKSDKLFLNLYGNSAEKMDANMDASIRFNNKLSTMIFGHFQGNKRKIDHNKDGFIDVPLINRHSLFNRWYFDNYNGLTMQAGIRYVDEERLSGQMDYAHNDTGTTPFNYGISIHNRRTEGFFKGGYVFPGPKEKSLAMVSSVSIHEIKSLYGKKAYEGIEETFNLKILYQDQLFNENHQYTAGFSYLYNDVKELFDTHGYNRQESVPGIFMEYTYKTHEKITLVGGIRADFHNSYGMLLTPRLHLRYGFNHENIVRISAGKGYHSAKYLMESSGFMASSRKLVVLENPEMEEAWNYGINYTRYLTVADHEMTINTEFYRSDFVNQFVADLDASSSEIRFYNLDGQSFSNNFQMGINYEPIHGLDLYTAFRYTDARTTIDGELRDKPLTSKYKGLLNASYRTQSKNWQFDFTWQMNGGGRIPSTTANPLSLQRPSTFDPFSVFNSQVTYFGKRWSVYAGVENLGDFRQENPIISAENPFSNHFDASLVWGPIDGRKFYAGIRFAIKREP